MKNEITINRTKPFDPESFFGKGWEIEEQDEQSIKLKKIDLSKIVFEASLKKGENYITGEERINRLKKEKRVRLDAKIFQFLWDNQKSIPENWKTDAKGNAHYIFFDGTILRSPRGRRCALCLCFGGGRWRWGYDWLGGSRGASYPSAVLASSSKLSELSPSFDPLDLEISYKGVAYKLIAK